MFEGFQIGFNDIIQILILYVGIYALIRFVHGTRSAQVLLGFCVLAVCLILLTYLFRFDVLARVIYFLLIYLALSMVVVFQQEIRWVLALVGGQRLFSHRSNAVQNNFVPQVLCRSVMLLSKAKIGALIAVERGISLSGYEASGVKLNALISHELMVSIFTPPLPLHDGGIIIREGCIAAAHCLFPVSHQSELATSGMRHRAAVGLSEETDAMIVIVSEETGHVSVAHNGSLHRYYGEKTEKILFRWVKKAMPHQTRGILSATKWMTDRLNNLLREHTMHPMEERHES